MSNKGHVFCVRTFMDSKNTIRNVSGNRVHKIGFFSEKKRVSEHLRCPNI